MKSKSLLTEYNGFEKEKITPIINDYDVFSDKNLLDELRRNIIENIIDNKLISDKPKDEFINEEIDRALNGRDLTNLERSHIYNMIDNEINGYGPLNELLNDNNISEIMVNGPNEV